MKGVLRKKERLHSLYDGLLSEEIALHAGDDLSRSATAQLVICSNVKLFSVSKKGVQDMKKVGKVIFSLMAC